MPNTRATHPNSPPDDVPPELAASSKFEILGKLGEGGMGAVYKAKHIFLDELVAIKVLHAGKVGNAGTRARFLREMRTVGQLKHPNIVRALDAEQMGDVLVLVMEYVAGITLDRLVAQRGPLPVDFACRCIVGAAQGLQHAHEKGLVHRDVKPANLIVTAKEKEVKLLDFGLARGSLGDVGPTNQTQLHAMLGSPLYMAPEQASNARGVDIRADVYGLGCTLYFLLAGRAPFVKQSVMDIILAHTREEPRPLPELRKEVPARLWEVVARMLAKKPAERFQTPDEVVKALRPFASASRRGPQPSRQGAEDEPAQTAKLAGGPPPTPVPVATPGPATVDEMSPFTLDDLPANKIAHTESPKQVKGGKRGSAPETPAERKKWLIGGTFAGGVLLLTVVGLSAIFIRRGKAREAIPVVEVNEQALARPEPLPIPPPKDGALVVEVNEPNAEVLLDGKPVVVAWDKDGKKTEIQVKPGAHKLEVKKTGFIARSYEVELAAGDRRAVTATLEAIAPPGAPSPGTSPAPKGPVASGPGQPSEPPASTPGRPGETVAPAPSRPAEPPDPMAVALAKDMETFEAARKSAAQTLLAVFDRELEALPRSKAKPDDRVKLIEAVKAERIAFEQRGRIPFSAPMRFAAKNYLDAIGTSRQKLSLAFDNAIDFHTRAQSLAKAREYTTKKQQAIQPHVVATWALRVKNGPPARHDLYSNGRIGSPVSPNRWTLQRNVLTFRWPNPKAPRGVWVDSCTLGPNGNYCSGKNQVGAGISAVKVN